MYGTLYCFYFLYIIPTKLTFVTKSIYVYYFIVYISLSVSAQSSHLQQDFITKDNRPYITT
jgi:hypothetical protein